MKLNQSTESPNMQAKPKTKGILTSEKKKLTRVRSKTVTFNILSMKNDDISELLTPERISDEIDTDHPGSEPCEYGLYEEPSVSLNVIYKKTYGKPTNHLSNEYNRTLVETTRTLVEQLIGTRTLKQRRGSNKENEHSLLLPAVQPQKQTFCSTNL